MPRSIVEAGLSDGDVRSIGWPKHTGARMSRKILLVDDSGAGAAQRAADARAAGYDVVEAEDGMAALERYFLEKPDLVLLDLVMKGMYGLDVLTKLREMDPAARVIVVSADVQDSSRELARRPAAPSDSSPSRSSATALLSAVAGALEGGA